MALQESMREDSTIIIMGEDVGRYGGAYGVTKGLIEEFGIFHKIKPNQY